MESNVEGENNLGYSQDSLNAPSNPNGPASYSPESPRQVAGTPKTSSARSLAASRRSRWGCNTCRKRKVKCDEGRPKCGHCIRLNLACDYDSAAAANAREYTPRRQQKARQRSAPTQQGSSPLQRDSSSQGHLSPWANHQDQRSSAVGNPQGVNTSRDESVAYDVAMPDTMMPGVNGDLQMSDQVMRLSGPDAWELELLGEDSLWANLPILSNFMSVQDSESYGPVTGSNSTRATFPTTSYPEPENIISQNPIQQDASQNAFAFTDEITLLRHFVDFAVPPILVGVEPRWNSSRDALLRLSKTTPHLRHAICAFSALSLGESPNSMPSTTAQSSTYYSELALSELHKQLDENEVPRHHDRNREHVNNNSRVSDDVSHGKAAEKSSSDESVLATIFFLSYIELIVANAPKTSLELLKCAHVLTSTKTPPSTTLYQQLTIWLKLLDAKVVSAGGEGTHLHTNTSTRDLDGVRDIYNDESTTTATTNETGTDSITTTLPSTLHLETSDILFHALNQRAYAFYLQVLTFSGRIARLDPWHRARGTPADELAVLLAADQIARDLDALWTRRPALLDLAGARVSRLAPRLLGPALARRVALHLRTYAAGFHACAIHLQRVAYAHLRATRRVREAVATIVRLTRLTVEEEAEAEDMEGTAGLPSSMLWPLMMAACEAEDGTTRDWIIGCIEGMASDNNNNNNNNGGDDNSPTVTNYNNNSRGRIGNAKRTAGLVREIVRRQTRTGMRADARGVMEESFGQVFAII